MEKQIKAMRMDKFLSQTLNVTRTEAKNAQTGTHQQK